MICIFCNEETDGAELCDECLDDQQRAKQGFQHDPDLQARDDEERIPRLPQIRKEARDGKP